MVRLIGDALRARRNRWWASGATFTYVVVYLLGIQNIVVSPSGGVSGSGATQSMQVVPDWTSRVFKQIAPFYYEPVAAIYLLDQVSILVSPVNIAMGLLLGALVGINVAVAIHAVRTARACRTRAFTGLLGALPGFLTGFACCVPTVALVLGGQVAVAALVTLRSYFFPFALLALLLSMLWNARNVRRVAIAT